MSTNIRFRASFLFGLLAVSLTACKSQDESCASSSTECPKHATTASTAGTASETKTTAVCPYLAEQGESTAAYAGTNPHGDSAKPAQPEQATTAPAKPTPAPQSEQPRVKRIDEWPSEKVTIGELPEPVRERLAQVALGGVLHELYRQNRLGDHKNYTYIFHIQRDSDHKFYIAEVATDGTLISNNPK